MYIYKQPRCLMGIRSDVILCIRNEAYRRLSKASTDTIEEYFCEYSERTAEGLLFEASDVKWYEDSYPALIALYKDLEDLGLPDDFLIVVATPEYPNTDDGDFGCWDDNPWGVRKIVSCCLEWYGAENSI